MGFSYVLCIFLRVKKNIYVWGWTILYFISKNLILFRLICAISCREREFNYGNCFIDLLMEIVEVYKAYLQKCMEGYKEKNQSN